VRLNGEVATLNVVVLDSNDFDPECTAATYSVTVLENQPVGTVLTGDYVAGTSCTDADATVAFSTLTYTLSGASASSFSVTSGGELRTAAIFDREALDAYTFNLSTTDGQGVTVSVLITVAIGDLNDVEPVFESGSLIFTLPESTPVGTLIGQTRAYDLDLNGNASLT
jgi:hypothetical protein